jgi:valyl-tRNA synthetase
MQNSNYNHHAIEKQIYDYWEKNNFFKPKKNKKKYFSVVIPPPNVTGSLHMGHALNNSLQDLLVRFHRMNGYETLWQPGTDHAGIATKFRNHSCDENALVNLVMNYSMHAPYAGFL